MICPDLKIRMIDMKKEGHDETTIVAEPGFADLPGVVWRFRWWTTGYSLPCATTRLLIRLRRTGWQKNNNRNRDAGIFGFTAT